MSRSLWMGVVAGMSFLGWAHGAAKWTDDFDGALATAAKDGKDVLIDFTGSDWCGWCIKLKDEVFAKDAFGNVAPNDFVLVELDFPRGEGKVTPEMRKRNEALAEKYGVEGYPTVILADAKGRPYAQTGYQEGGAEKYLAHLAELRKTRVARDEAFGKAAKAEGKEKADLLAQGLTKMDPAMQKAFYSDELTMLKAVDPDDTTGVMATLKAMEEEEAKEKRAQEEEAAFAQKAGPIIEKLGPLMDEGKPDEAVKVVEDWLKANEGEDKSFRQRIAFIIVQVHGSGEAHAKALKALDDAVAIDPDSDFSKIAKERIRPAIEKAMAGGGEGKEEAPPAGE